MLYGFNGLVAVFLFSQHRYDPYWWIPQEMICFGSKQASLKPDGPFCPYTAPLHNSHHTPVDRIFMALLPLLPLWRPFY